MLLVTNTTRTLVLEKSAYKDFDFKNLKANAIESLTIRVFKKDKIGNSSVPDRDVTQLDPIIAQLKTLILIEDTGTTNDYYDDLVFYLK